VEKKQLLVSQKEIEKQLQEVNLTHDPVLLNKRRKWFREHEIKIFTMYGKTYLTPIHVKVTEIIRRLDIINRMHVRVRVEQDEEKLQSYAAKLKSELEWFQEHELHVRLVEFGEISYYIYE